MEVTVEAAALSQALQRLKGVVLPRSKQLMAPLTGALLSAKGAALTVTGFDGEVAVVSEVPCEVKGAGTAMLPQEAFEFVGALRGALVMARKGSVGLGTCSVATGAATSARFHEPSSPEDFPKLPEPCATHPVDGAALRDMLRRVSHAVYRAGYRPGLDGVHLHTLKDGRHRAVATDGKRIAVLTRKLGDFEFSKPSPAAARDGITLPLSAVAKLGDVLEAFEPQGWEFGCTATSAVLRRPGFLLLTKLVEAPFPEYERVISEEHASVTVPREALLASLERVALVDKSVGLVLEAGVLRFAAKSDKMGEGDDTVQVKERRGVPRRAWFSYKYLSEALHSAECEEVLVSVPPQDNPSRTPAFIETAGEDGYLACVIPLSGMGN